MLYIVDPNNQEEMAKAQAHSDRMVMRALEMGGTCTGNMAWATERFTF